MKYDMVAFDLDGVIVTERSSWEWVHRHFGADNSESLAAFCNGEIDDMEFMRTDIAKWMRINPGVTSSHIKEILMGAKLIEGAREAIQSIKSTGARTCIVSGGIDLLADHIGEICGVDRVISNGLRTDEQGKLIGDGILRVELRDKASALLSIAKDFDIDPAKCAAVGNSWVDVSMFEVCGLGIAFNPIDSKTITEADVVVESNDLRDILPHLD